MPSLRSRHARNRGFTLIELIAVVVILGVLAATAIPRFLDLRRDARINQLQSISGQIAAGSQSARIALVAAGGDLNATNQFATVNGRTIRMNFGWPASTTDGVARVVDVSFTTGQVCGGNPDCYAWVLTGPSGSCNANYTQATAPGATPVFSFNALEC